MPFVKGVGGATAGSKKADHPQASSPPHSAHRRARAAAAVPLKLAGRPAPPKSADAPVPTPLSRRPAASACPAAATAAVVVPATPPRAAVKLSSLDNAGTVWEVLE